MHKKLSEELRAKYPVITRGYSMVKFADLDDAFFEVFQLQASPLEGQHCSKKKRKGGKGKAKKTIKKYKSLTWKDVGHFLVSKF